MGYQQALDKAWQNIMSLTAEKQLSAAFLSDTYDIDTQNKTILSRSCNVPAKDNIAIIILHYLVQKLTFKAIPEASGQWIDFKELEGGEGYYPAFKKRTIDRVLHKYGASCESLLKVEERMPAKPGSFGDVSMVVYPFPETGILITMSKADEEFGPSANILFDSNISKTFCTEDIVVLTEIVVHQL